MTIGDRIKHCREALSITQTALADIVGTTKQNIYKYENGIITNIPSDRVEAIAAALNTTPTYLMGWDDILSHISKESSSGRAVAKEDMFRTYGTEHSTSSLRLIDDKVALLYYKAMDRYSTASLLNMIEAVDDLERDDIENISQVVRAYLRADPPIKKIVDTALQPYFTDDLSE